MNFVGRYVLGKYIDFKFSFVILRKVYFIYIYVEKIYGSYYIV